MVRKKVQARITDWYYTNKDTVKRDIRNFCYLFAAFLVSFFLYKISSEDIRDIFAIIAVVFYAFIKLWLIWVFFIRKHWYSSVEYFSKLRKGEASKGPLVTSIVACLLAIIYFSIVLTWGEQRELYTDAFWDNIFKHAYYLIIGLFFAAFLLLIVSKSLRKLVRRYSHEE